MSAKPHILLAGSILLAIAGSAAAGEYRDPSGFSLTLPKGWEAVNRQTIDDSAAAVPEDVKANLAKNRMDLNRVAALIVHNGAEDYKETVNVIVSDTEIPLVDQAAAQLKDTIVKQFGSIGAKVDKLDVRVRPVGRLKAIGMDYEIVMPGETEARKSHQAMIPLGGKTYTFTCTSKIETFKKYEPTFEKIMGSLKAPPVKK